MNLIIETIFGFESKSCTCDFEIRYQELSKGIGEEDAKDIEKDFLNPSWEKQVCNHKLKASQTQSIVNKYESLRVKE